MESSSSVAYINKISHHIKFNYSQIKDLEPEEFVTSPVFHAFGHDCVIDFYPRGSLIEGPFVTLFAYFLVRDQGTCNKNVDTIFSCSLVKRDGTRYPLLPHALEEQGIVVFQSPLPDDDIDIYELEEVFVKNCCFELICTVSNTDKPTMSVPKSFGLLSQIGNLLESPETADVTFDVGERSFMCHRAVLASRSTVLKAELFGSMAEAQQNVIKMKDMCPEVFEAMLHFMYTDSFPCCDSENTLTKMTQHLFEASDRYAIDGLKALLEDHLCASISLDTVAATLVLAEQHNSPRLKNSCLQFLGEPGTLISWILTDEYVDLVRSFPSILGEIRTTAYTIPFVRDIKKRNTW